MVQSKFNAEKEAQDKCILITSDGKQWAAVRGDYEKVGSITPNHMGVGITPEIALKNLLTIEERHEKAMERKLTNGKNANEDQSN